MVHFRRFREIASHVINENLDLFNISFPFRHMAEETHFARKSAPSGLIYTCIATSIGGLMFILAMMCAA